ncbi:hypothetical protein AAFN46_17105 [Pseudomonas sp. CAU 1711]|uniref:hypothetical protein n=1 Tax=Pseudomonas sp. CAU 1711 TaxID=3140356 RepID=UPI003260B043
MPCIAQPDGREISLVYVDVEADPFQTGSGSEIADPPGLAVEMVVEAVRLAGYSPKLRRMPQMRMLWELEEGSIDGAFIFSYTPERGALYAYPMRNGEPDGALRVTRIRYSLYRLKGAPVGWDGQDFSGLTRPIGVNTGWVMASLLAQRGLPVDDSGRGHTELRQAAAEAHRRLCRPGAGGGELPQTLGPTGAVREGGAAAAGEGLFPVVQQALRA